MKRLGYAVNNNPQSGWQFEFTSIPQDHKNLKILYSLKADTSNSDDKMYIYFQVNGTWVYGSDSATYVTYQRGTANGAMSWIGRTGAEGYSYLIMPYQMMTTANVYANDFGSGEINIYDYSNTSSPYKTLTSSDPSVWSYGSATTNYSYLKQSVGCYGVGTSGSTHVTGIRIRSYSGSADKYKAGSSVGLYGLD